MARRRRPWRNKESDDMSRYLLSEAIDSARQGDFSQFHIIEAELNTPARRKAKHITEEKFAEWKEKANTKP